MKGLHRYIQYREHDRLITAFLQKVMTINENGKKGPMIYNRGHFIYYFPHDFSGRTCNTYYTMQQKAQSELANQISKHSGTLREAIKPSPSKYGNQLKYVATLNLHNKLP